MCFELLHQSFNVFVQELLYFSDVATSGNFRITTRDAGGIAIS
jgi:hypothetical protein